MIDRLRHFVGTHRIVTSMVLAAGLWFLARPALPSILAGFPLILVGEGIRTWASGQIEKNKRLAREGPYALTRNPLYLGHFFLGLGFCVMAGRWLVSVIFLPTFAFIYSATIRAEEETLQKLFGREFEAYRSSVPRFFPRFRSGPTGGRFRWDLVRKHREFNTWIGIGAGVTVLLLKPILFGWG